MCDQAELNVLMESKGGKKSSSSKSLFYEAPLGYSIEDVRPNGGIKKFRSAAYSNVSLAFNILLSMHCICEFVLAVDDWYCSSYVDSKYCFIIFCSALASHPDIPQSET